MERMRRRSPSEWLTLAGWLLLVQAAIALFVVPSVAVNDALEIHDVWRGVAIVAGIAALAVTPLVLGIALQSRLLWAWKPAALYTATTMGATLVGGAVVDTALGSLFIWNLAAAVILFMGPVRHHTKPPPERADQQQRFHAHRTRAAGDEPRLGAVVRRWNPDKARGDS